MIIRGWLRRYGPVVGIVVSIGTAAGLYLSALVPQPWWFLGVVVGPLATWFLYRRAETRIERLKEALEAVERQASGSSSYVHYEVETGQRVYVI